MSIITFRIAKPEDANRIAYVHYHIRDKYDKGFFAQVNYAFLKQYYKVVLNDPYEIIICAEDTDQRIIGFSSSSLNSERQFERMRKKKLSFLFPLLTSALSNPKLIIEAIKRYKSIKGNSREDFIVTAGPRVEYWGWLPGRDDSDNSVVMQDLMFFILKLFGVDKVYFEVDKINKRIFKFHKINGAEEVKTFKMPDGRERVELFYDLDNYSFKIL